ncbi:HEAT repeat-containing protein 3-like [Anneissia japonica]|uniref:HEAT repeat-containing protein 3-like n=1 Tax=Anneissia japonica TaxID=1529436 RepID=UPI0014258690|nr:HEAT repeat-containing protein 3-like [Anneissia japonica]
MTMGKSKNKRFKSKKPRPTGLPSVKEMEELDETGGADSVAAGGDIKQNALNMFEKLQSPSSEDRACGCSSIANLVMDKTALQLLLQQGVVKTLGPLLLDKSDIVREGATGSLRNMSVAGGHEVCDRMIRDDVMTPLLALLQQYGKDLPDVVLHGSDHRVPSTSILEQALHLLWNLCESSNIAVSIFNKEDILPLVIHCFKADAVNMALATTAAQCLHTITEDNDPVASALSTPEMLSVLEKALMNPGNSSSQCLFKTLTAGIFCNIKSRLPAGSQGQTLQALVKVLAQTLEADATLEVASFLETHPEENGINGTSNKDDGMSVDTDTLKISKMEDLKNLLLCQQTALEIISNLSCFEDEGDDWVDMDCSSSSSEDSQEDEVETMNEEPEIMSPLCLASEIHNALVAQSLPVKVLAKLSFPEKQLLENLEVSTKYTCLAIGLLRLQCRGLVCLNNLITAVELEVLGGPPALVVVWEKLLALALSDHVPSGEEFLEALTSALRSVIQKMATVKQAPQGLNQHHVSQLCNLGKTSPCEGIRVNILGMLGSIGSLLAFEENAEQTVAAVGIQLIDIATKDPSIWVIAEALDAIFDTFGDGKTADVVAERINLVVKLRNMVPQLKSKMRQNKGNLGDRLPIVQNAKMNLIRFIKYKETQQ